MSSKANAGWHANYGTIDVPADNAWQSAFHSGHDDDSGAILQLIDTLLQTVGPGHTDIIHFAHRHVHPLQRLDRLLRLVPADGSSGIALKLLGH